MAGTLTAHEDAGDLLYGRTPRLRSVVILHCLSGRCQRFGILGNVLHGEQGFLGFTRVLRPPASPVVILRVLQVVKTCNSYVGVYGKGLPVDSFPCFYLIFLLCPR